MSLCDFCLYKLTKKLNVCFQINYLFFHSQTIKIYNIHLRSLGQHFHLRVSSGGRAQMRALHKLHGILTTVWEKNFKLTFPSSKQTEIPQLTDRHWSPSKRTRSTPPRKLSLWPHYFRYVDASPPYCSQSKWRRRISIGKKIKLI